MQVAICPFKKLRVVIALDHAIRKEGLARITATAARTLCIKSATFAVISQRSIYCWFSRGCCAILIGNKVQFPSTEKKNKNKNKQKKKRERERKGKQSVLKLGSMALVIDSFDT